MRRKTAFLCIFVVILVFSFTTSIFADTWYNNYENALKEVKKKNWPGVIQYIQAALADKKEPQLSSRTVGIRFVDYLPFYYLGVAYYQLNKYEEAKTAFEQSLNSGEIRKRANLFERMQQMLTECRGKKRPGTDDSQEKPIIDSEVEEKASSRVKQSIVNGDRLRQAGNISAAKAEYLDAKQRIEQSGEQGPLLSEVERKIREITEIEKIDRWLRQAEDRYNSKKYEEAEQILQQVLKDNPRHEKAGLLLSQVRQILQSKASGVSKTAAGNEEKIKPEESRPQTGTAVEQLMEQGEQLFRQGKRNEAGEKFSAVLQLEAGHSRAVEWLKTIDYSKTVQALNNGIKSYFNSEYIKSEEYLQEAIHLLLKDAESPGPKYKKTFIMTYQFLAIVLIEKYYLGDDTSGKTLQEARDYISRIFTLDPDFRLEASFFSPKVAEEFSRVNIKK